jgi:hypothetical protein
MVSKNMPNYPHHIPNYLLVMMMMTTGTDSTSQPKVPFGCNNGRQHAETDHPDEKQYHMVSKNMTNYPHHIPNYLLVVMVMPTGMESTAQGSIKVQQWTTTY